MQSIVTEQERKDMHKRFSSLVSKIGLFSLFPRRQREQLVERLVDIAVSESENKEPPKFPPEGFEVVLTKTLEAAATLRKSDDDFVGTDISEQSDVNVPVKNVL
jgi:hypothetical protein